MIPQDAISAAQSCQKIFGIPASVQLAQFILESGNGQHMPGNNPFGIKALSGQPSQMLTTHEFVGGHYKTVQAPFAVFASLQDAFTHHAALLAHADCYARARSYLEGRNGSATSPAEQFAIGLSGVYATDPNYGQKLINIMRQDGLAQYDQTPA